MTVLLVITGLVLVMINNYLLAFALVDDCTCDCCILYSLTDLHLIAADADHVVKCDFRAALALDLLDINAITF